MIIQLRSLFSIFVFSMLLSCHSLAQKFTYKKVPQNALKMTAVTNQERNLILKNIQKPFYLENALPKGHSKKGDTDYTDVIQKALSLYRNVIFPNFPLLINEKGLNVSSHSILYFQPLSKLVLKPTSLRQYEILRIHDVNNIKVYFPVIQGDRYTHLAKDGEWGMGISIRGTENILIYAPKVTECWGDGIYLGISPATQSTKNNRVKIIKGLVDDNRRNGISIITAQNMEVTHFIASNTYGTPPTAGIDIEPDTNQEDIKNLSFNNIITYNNFTHGFLFVLGNLYGKENNIGNITVTNFKAMYSEIGMSFKIGPFTKTNVQPSGNIIISNAAFENISRQDYLSYDENIDNSFKVKIKSNSKNSSTLSTFFENAKNISVSK